MDASRVTVTARRTKNRRGGLSRSECGMLSTWMAGARPPSTFITGLSVQAAYTNAVISWATVSNATTQIEYGFTTAYGSSTTPDPTLTTNHAVSLTGLVPGTNYYFRALSTIGSNV